jgi:NTE family protein
MAVAAAIVNVKIIKSAVCFMVSLFFQADVGVYLKCESLSIRLMENKVKRSMNSNKRWTVTAVGGLVLLALGGCVTAPSPPPKAVELTATTLEKREVKLGLALGGGAARGFAHVGVIQVLEEAGLKPSHVVGTSAGSLVAALYASGKTSAELNRLAENLQEADITDWMLPILNRGALRGEALARYVNSQVGGRTLEQMNIPLGIVATDLNSGESITFRRGNTGSAVRASSAVPAVFQPVRIGEREFVDGGLVAPVPVRQTRDMGANFVLAVDISSDPEGNPSADTFQILMQTFTIMGKSINTLALKEADFVVRPALAGVKSADFNARMRSIEAGRVAMRNALPSLKTKLAEFEASR